jgi:cytochrome c551/c552
MQAGCGLKKFLMQCFFVGFVTYFCARFGIYPHFSSTANMIPHKPGMKKPIFLVFFLFLFSFSKISAQDGKALFIANCAACHALDVDLTGPKLSGVLDREPYNGDMKKVLNWVHNTTKLVETDPYYKALKARFNNQVMPPLALPDKDLEAIINYANNPPPPPPTATDGPGAPASSNWVIFGIITLIMAIIAIILMQVNSNLKKLSDDVEGIQRPEPVPFFRNKAYIALLTIILFVFAGYYVTKAAIGLGRQHNYQPEQPIYYSHKVHAGINQISCLYCHGNAWESRHAAIPSVNVCMNCHKTITSYSGAPLYKENGDSVNGTAQLQKLFRYAGFDPKNPNAWNPDNARPIPWVKIHSLPDHVYFNHAQHIRAGNVQCQTCHGAITEMDEVKQFSELSMSWCINCHRTTKVNFSYTDSTGNKFYQSYKDFRNAYEHKKMDSITVKDIGGTECQRCHY